MTIVTPRRQDGQRMRKRQKNDQEEKEMSVEVSARGFCYRQSVYRRIYIIIENYVVLFNAPSLPGNEPPGNVEAAVTFGGSTVVVVWIARNVNKLW